MIHTLRIVVAIKVRLLFHGLLCSVHESYLIEWFEDRPDLQTFILTIQDDVSKGDDVVIRQEYRSDIR